MGMQDKTVIINSLDEYNGDSEQSKIIELVAKQMIEYSDKISLLQAFFSHLESYIDCESLPYFRSHIFAKIELPMSESDNNNIKLYFHDKFCPLASGNTVWLSEDTLDIFVLMVAGL